MARIGRRLVTFVLIVLALGMLVSVPGVAAAESTTENSADNADEDAGSPVDENDTDHQRDEHYVGSDENPNENPNLKNAYNGLASACTTPAYESPEGEFWCTQGN